MKKKNLLLSMNDIDDKYIEEARASSKKRRKKWPLILVAAVLTVFTALNLLLFVPYNVKPPEIRKYSGSEYYEVIDKLNTFYYNPPKYKNNFEAIIGGLTSASREVLTGVLGGGYKNAGTDDAMVESEGNTMRDPMDGSAPIPEMSVDEVGSNNADGTKDDGDKYQEVTDNQVKGVIEADLVKRSDKYIYYINNASAFTLKIYSIAGEESVEVGSLNTSAVFGNANVHSAEMYLSQDCKTVTLLYKGYCFTDSYGENAVWLMSLDVTDPANIKTINNIKVQGGFISSRLVDGELYLVTNYNVKRTKDFSEETEFVPYVTTNGGNQLVSSDCIYYPEELSSSSYTVLNRIDPKSLEIKSDFALLSFDNAVVYASKSSFYVARTYYETTEEGDTTLRERLSEICRVDYSSGEFKLVGSSTVKGSVKDQYSMDEHEGVLRVFTTTDTHKTQKTENGSYYMQSLDSGVNASLFCVDINSFKTIAKVEAFAPKGESVQSARFDGDNAYVCTSIVFSDPVFFFDLSDYNNITFIETGTIEGYSSSLVDFGEGYLLGVGMTNWSTPKIEIYKEQGDKVVPITAIEFPDSNISADYKAYFIDRERQIIGLGVYSRNYNDYYSNLNTKYVILKLENDVLKVVYDQVYSTVSRSVNYMRAMYIDGYFYIVGEYGLKVVAETALK